jgi:hypothetical protein
MASFALNLPLLTWNSTVKVLASNSELGLISV